LHIICDYRSLGGGRAGLKLIGGEPLHLLTDAQALNGIFKGYAVMKEFGLNLMSVESGIIKSAWEPGGAYRVNSQ
jgi:hypothetical protein